MYTTQFRRDGFGVCVGGGDGLDNRGAKFINDYG